MLQLSDSQLLLASKWKAIDPSFSWEQSDPRDKWLFPMADRLRHLNSVGLDIVGDGGNESYGHIFLYDPAVFPREEENEIGKTLRYEGVSIYLCLIGPYAAIGRSRRHMTYYKEPAYAGGNPPRLSTSDLIEDASVNDPIVETAFSEAKQAGYLVLSRQELQSKLPNGIEPFDTRGCGQPPYTYFDLLFNNSD